MRCHGGDPYMEEWGGNVRLLATRSVQELGDQYSHSKGNRLLI